MVEVAEIDLRFGLGAAVMDEDVTETTAEMRAFPKSWLRLITSSPPSQLYWARGVGNSMEPNIGDGEVILIDRSQQSPAFADIYWAIAYGQTGMIKRLRPMPDGSVKILSDNPNVPPETAYDGELHIFGRVIAVVKRI
ncbi:MAG: helix-turn-helix transcriptional regulator [Sphingomonadaceae bacterium]